MIGPRINFLNARPYAIRGTFILVDVRGYRTATEKGFPPDPMLP